MAELMGPFSRLTSKRVLVLGDLMLDAYTFGKAQRISPEAPVAIVHAASEEKLPGGAGNVVLNLLSLGCEVELIGRIGSDEAGKILKSFFKKEKVPFHPVVDEAFKTPVKHRIIANNQQLIRIDHEEAIPLSKKCEDEAVQALSEIIHTIDIIALSDYAKGFLTHDFCQRIITIANEFDVPVIADPKGLDYSKYRGVKLLKPNRKEAYEAAHLPSSKSLDEVAQSLLKITEAEFLVLTLSEEGISVFDKTSRRNFPVKVKEVKDVTGAGDTVLATLVAGIASGLSIDESAQLANVAASVAIEHVGCARVTLSDLARRLLDIDVHNKIFDEQHLFALSHALSDQNFHILEVHPEADLNTELYQKIRKYQLKPLIINFKSKPNDHLVDMLTSLREVSYILIGEPAKLKRKP